MNTTGDPVTAARAAALFVSDLSTADQPTRTRAEHAILRAIRTHGGSRGCLADMAAYYGDYPDLAAARMVWARAVAEGLRRRTSMSHAQRATPEPVLALAARPVPPAMASDPPQPQSFSAVSARDGGGHVFAAVAARRKANPGRPRPARSR